MKVFAVTEHSCANMEDDTDVLVGLFFKEKDAVKAMNERFDDWVKDIDLNKVNLANGEKIWGEIERGENFIYLINESDGWSCDHIILTVEEVEVK